MMSCLPFCATDPVKAMLKPTLIGSAARADPTSANEIEMAATMRPMFSMTFPRLFCLIGSRFLQLLLCYPPSLTLPQGGGLGLCPLCAPFRLRSCSADDSEGRRSITSPLEGEVDPRSGSGGGNFLIVRLKRRCGNAGSIRFPSD